MEFKSKSRYFIAGRGDVIVVENDIDRDRGNSGLIGETVKIDGELYLIKGVESFALDIIRKGQPIGLLVSAVGNKV